MSHHQPFYYRIKEIVKRNNKILILSVIFFMYFLFRIPDLGYDMSNSDAVRWHRRSENFLKALKEFDFASTYQHYQPGVILMWISAPIEQLTFWYQMRVNPAQPKTLENADWYPVLHGILKVVLVVSLGFLLLFQVHLISKIFTESVSYFFGFAMSVEPYLIGIDRWYHVTSLETYLVFTALLCLLYFYKLSSEKHLVLSAVLLGLAALTKITSIILIPLFVVVIIRESRKNSVVLDFLRFIGVFCLTFVLFFPAIWVEPFGTLGKIFGGISQMAASNTGGSFLFIPLVVLYKLSPVTLLLLVFSIVRAKKLIKNNHELLYVLIYPLFYLLTYTLSDKKVDRYVLTLIPAFLLLISLFMANLKKSTQMLYISISVFFILYVSISCFPVYSAYYSPVFGGTKEALRLGVYDNSGEYFAQAAFHLNKKGRNVNVYVPDNIESFSYFYKGNTQREFDQNTDFIVRSLDTERKTVIESDCPKVEYLFGPVDEFVVYVFSCKRL